MNVSWYWTCINAVCHKHFIHREMEREKRGGKERERVQGSRDDHSAISLATPRAGEEGENIFPLRKITSHTIWFPASLSINAHFYQGIKYRLTDSLMSSTEEINNICLAFPQPSPGSLRYCLVHPEEAGSQRKKDWRKRERERERWRFGWKGKEKRGLLFPYEGLFLIMLLYGKSASCYQTNMGRNAPTTYRGLWSRRHRPRAWRPWGVKVQCLLRRGMGVYVTHAQG